MSWLIEIKENYFINKDVPLFVRYEDGADTWDVVTNLFIATRFGTKEEALAAIEKFDSRDITKPTEYEDARVKFDKWIIDGAVVLQYESKNLELSRKYNPDIDTREDVLKWRFQALAHGGIISYEDYKTWPELYSIYEHIHSTARFISYDGSDEVMQTVEVYVHQDSDFEKFMEELAIVIPHVTSRYDEDERFLRFPVSDRFLCENGDKVDLMYDPDTGDAEIHGRYETVMTGTIEEAFEYLCRYRYCHHYV